MSGVYKRTNVKNGLLIHIEKLSGGLTSSSLALVDISLRPRSDIVVYGLSGLVKGKGLCCLRNLVVVRMRLYDCDNESFR